ncbi:MAG TPA: hypothetical protein VF744_00775 [Beijerinckiaceae bacterium]|jgi:hypothetical protein
MPDIVGVPFDIVGIVARHRRVFSTSSSGKTRVIVDVDGPL